VLSGRLRPNIGLIQVGHFRADAGGLPEVVPLEAVSELRKGVQRLHPSGRVPWIAESLPELSWLEASFGLALLPTVGMHLSSRENVLPGRWRHTPIGPSSVALPRASGL
jgi:hypothetical protein